MTTGDEVVSVVGAGWVALGFFFAGMGLSSFTYGDREEAVIHGVAALLLLITGTVVVFYRFS